MSYALSLNQQLAVPGPNLDGYAQAIKTIPMLSVEQERKLAQLLHNENDFEAARVLVVSHLRFVMHIAHSYRGYGLPQSDLIQEQKSMSIFYATGVLSRWQPLNPNVSYSLTCVVRKNAWAG